MFEGSKGLYLMVASTLIALIIGIILGNTLISSSTPPGLGLNKQPSISPQPHTPPNTSTTIQLTDSADLVSAILATQSVSVNLTATIISVDSKNSTLTAKADNSSSPITLPVDPNVRIDTTPSHQKSSGLEAIKLNQTAYISLTPQGGSYKVMSILYPETK